MAAVNNIWHIIPEVLGAIQVFSLARIIHRLIFLLRHDIYRLIYWVVKFGGVASFRVGNRGGTVCCGTTSSTWWYRAVSLHCRYVGRISVHRLGAKIQRRKTMQ